jgi:hypothetical protein
LSIWLLLVGVEVVQYQAGVVVLEDFVLAQDCL